MFKKKLLEEKDVKKETVSSDVEFKSEEESEEEEDTKPKKTTQPVCLFELIFVD